MSLIKNGKKIAGLYKATEVEHATEERAGIIEIANQSEVLEGSNDTKAVTSVKLKENYYNKTEVDSLLDEKQDKTDNSLVTLDKTVVGAVNELDAKIKEITILKAPNVLIVGEPTINKGQVIGFSKTNYLVLPFEFDVKDRAFELTYGFSTGTDIATVQNLFGSKFSIASHISGGKLTVRVSSNGTSWDILDAETSLQVQSNTTYYIKLIFNKLNYEIKASTDGVTYSQIGYVVDTRAPFAGDVFIGIGNNQNNPFLGIINLHKWELKYNNFVFWEGMDDAGLATRANISLSNLDEIGEARFGAKQDVIEDLATIRSNAQAGKFASDTIATYGDIVTHNASEFQVIGDYATNTALTEGLATKQDTIEDLSDIRSNASAGATAKSTVDTHVANTTIHVTAQDKVAWSNKQNKLTAGTNISIDEKTNTISASGVLTEVNWGDINGTLADQTDLQTALNGKQATIDDLGTIRSNATAGKGAADTISTYGDIVTHDASEFQAAGDYATNTRVNGVEQTANNAKAIAEGKSTGYVFDTKEAMDSWIAEHKAELKLGDNLYIRATDVPDYWWDGTKAQELETQKVDLSEYAKSVDVVPNTRKVNNKALSADITLTASDVGATTMSEVEAKDYATNTALTEGLATKQATISDLSTIRSNAEAGKGAADTIETYGDIVTHNIAEFQAAGDYATNTALTQGLATKQDTIEDLEDIRSGAELGSTALQSVPDTYATKDFVTGQGYITADYHDSTKQDTISDLASIRSNATAGKGAADTIATYGNIVTHNANEFQAAGDYATNTRVNEVEAAIPTDNAQLTNGAGYITTAYHDATKQDVIEDLEDIRSGAELGATALQSFTETDPTVPAHVKAITAQNISDWNAKQGTIEDINTIRSNAEAGKGAADTIATYGNIVTHNASEFQAAGDYATNTRVDEVEAAIPTDNAQLANGAGYVTAAYHDATKQDVIADLDDIRSGAELGATALQSFTETDPTVPSHVKAITTQNIADWNAKQGTIEDIDTIRANAEAGKSASDTIATYGNIVTHNASEFQVAGDYATNTRVNEVEEAIPTDNSQLANGAGYVTAAYHDATKQDVIADLDDIRSGAELGATALQSFIETDPTVPAHVKAITSQNITDWNSKQASISDLETIRVNATAGKSASDTIATYGNIVTHNTSEFQAAGDYATNDRVDEVEASIPTDNAQLDNGAGYITAAYHDSTKQNVINDLEDIRSGAALGATALQSFTETDPTVPAHVKAITAQNISDWNAKQGSITDIDTIRSNAEAGKGAADTIETYGDIVTHNAVEFQAAGDYATNTALTQGLAGKQDTISDLATIRSNAATGAGLATQVSTNTSNIAQEVSDRQDADAGLQEQIDAIVASSDVKDIIGTYVELETYDKSTLGDNDIIKVLEDSTQNNASTYYRFKSATQTFEYIGKEGPFYTKSETDGLLNNKQDTISDLSTIRENATAGKSASTTIAGYGDIVTHNASEFQAAGSYVPTTRKVNNKALSADITLTASDVGATTMAAVEGKGYAVAADLATVATSGKYTDLTDLPTIPSEVTESTVAGWGFTKNTGTYSKPTGGIPATDLASAVQTSLGLADTALQSITSSDVTSALGFTPYNATNPEGYTSNKGTVTSVNNVSPVDGNVTLNIPTVNNATLTIQKNGTDVATFTANSSTNATANISVPTKVSELTNDSGFTSNTGTVTSVNNISPVNGNVTLSIPSEVTESTVAGWGFTKNTGTYSKPSTGIPKTDLASAVQTSLGKADTALQSFTETDPTVPSHVKAITTQNISGWNAKQEALISGTNIKTINGESILGSGNMEIGGGSELDITLLYND